MDSRSMSSRLRDLVKFLSSVQGDLSNITAPPHFLAGSSVVEVGHCWAQRPAVFAAPALEPSAERRSWLVLRLVLMALRSQFYVGGSPTVSIKKPLNAFLGELFVASWHDAEGKATTRLVAEQVSHHPPITAMHIADTEHGVRADGYARVNMTFGGSVDVRQVGHAVLHVDRYDEDYLIPLPDVKVRGFLGGRLYPEICGTYTIVSSSGFVSEINFSGAGYFCGQKNSFSARTYRRDDPSRRSIYTVSGCWSDGWTALDARTGEVLEKYDCEGFEHVAVPAELPPLAEQDPFESRRAWAGVLDGLARGDFRAVVQEKTALEQAQRRMRAEEKSRGHKGESGWTPLFFESMSAEEHEVFQRLAKGTEWALHADKTKGVWRVREEAVGGELKRPFREGMTPLGYQ